MSEEDYYVDYHHPNGRKRARTEEEEEDVDLIAVAHESMREHHRVESLTRSEMEAYFESQNIMIKSLVKNMVRMETADIQISLEALDSKVSKCLEQFELVRNKVDKAQILELHGLDRVISNIKGDLQSIYAKMHEKYHQ
jgi:hypothetical protein